MIIPFSIQLSIIINKKVRNRSFPFSSQRVALLKNLVFICDYPLFLNYSEGIKWEKVFVAIVTSRKYCEFLLN